MKLDDAKKSYDTKDYNSSAQIYEEYAKKTDNGQAYYNAGNAYYKNKEYLKALSAYSFARIKNKDLHNYPVPIIISKYMDNFYNGK